MVRWSQLLFSKGLIMEINIMFLIISSSKASDVISCPLITTCLSKFPLIILHISCIKLICLINIKYPATYRLKFSILYCPLNFFNATSRCQPMDIGISWSVKPHGMEVCHSCFHTVSFVACPFIYSWFIQGLEYHGMV